MNRIDKETNIRSKTVRGKDILLKNISTIIRKINKKIDSSFIINSTNQTK